MPYIRVDCSQIQMWQSPVTKNLTLETMVTNHSLYSLSGLNFCIENGHFIVHVSMLFNMS
jgi:hypothetical protein